MKIRYLLDENLPPKLQSAVLVALNTRGTGAIAGMEILYSEENGKFSHCDRNLIV